MKRRKAVSDVPSRRTKKKTKAHRGQAASVALRREILFFGRRVILACDAKCTKAWGINSRPSILLDAMNPDDYVWMADDELERAPVDPGTYEFTDGKPRRKLDRLNRWCARECERSRMVPVGAPITLRDFSKRIYNIPRPHRSDGGGA
jgi:hypothetical protein